MQEKAYSPLGKPIKLRGWDRLPEPELGITLHITLGNPIEGINSILGVFNTYEEASQVCQTNSDCVLSVPMGRKLSEYDWEVKYPRNVPRTAEEENKLLKERITELEERVNTLTWSIEQQRSNADESRRDEW